MSEPDLAAKVAFLADPANHPVRTAAVATVETHRSWVFLADRHAWKLRKAVAADGPDLTRVEAREAQCRNEVALNRRLTTDVYLGVVPLALGRDGRLAFDGEGRVVDWLVWMRRLPAGRMLDRMLETGEATAAAIAPAIERLAAFYRRQPSEGGDPAGRRELLQHRALESVAALSALGPGAGALADIFPAAFERCGEAIARRVREGRIVEGHGDLRPEHLCLEAPPQVIDCLEFCRELRVVDPAEELGFLALECERLGAPALKGPILEILARVTGDHPPPALVHLYQALHAAVRGRLALEHAADPGPAGAARWIARARGYVGLAGSHLDASLTAG